MERPDGLITGTTHWVSHGPDGQELFRGSEPLLGARDRDRLILEEAADAKTHTPQMVFHCSFEGPERIRVIGCEVGCKDLTVMRFVLVRDSPRDKATPETRPCVACEGIAGALSPERPQTPPSDSGGLKNTRYCRLS